MQVQCLLALSHWNAPPHSCVKCGGLACTGVSLLLNGLCRGMRLIHHHVSVPKMHLPVFRTSTFRRARCTCKFVHTSLQSFDMCSAGL